MWLVVSGVVVGELMIMMLVVWVVGGWWFSGIGDVSSSK